jgi:uncharacterized protein YggE
MKLAKLLFLVGAFCAAAIAQNLQSDSQTITTSGGLISITNKYSAQL